MFSFRRRFHKGQTLIEYAIVISLIAAVTVAMYTYVMRSVQSVQKDIEESAR